MWKGEVMHSTGRTADNSKGAEELPRKLLRYLDWDSEFFGLQVNEISPKCSLTQLPRTISEAASRGCTVAYWKPPSLQLVGPIWLVNSRVLDQIVFSKDLSQAAATTFQYLGCPNFTISRLRESTADDDVFGLALQAGWNSRFRVDPRFGNDSFRRLYRRWIDQSCSSVASDAVFVVRDQAGSSPAMVSLSITGNECRIALIAVSPEFRRQGLGRLMMQQSERFAMSRGCDRLIVTTQTNNLAAIKLYKDLGFHESSRVSIFHFWIDSVMASKDL